MPGRPNSASPAISFAIASRSPLFDEADAPAWQASGYNAMRDYVAGTEPRDAALERVVIAARQYAKRQRTWFRHQLPSEGTLRLDPDRPDAVQQAVAWIRAHAANSRAHVETGQGDAAT